jgi:rare lipoprotein A
MKKVILTLTLITAALCIPVTVAAQAFPTAEAFRQEGIASWYGPEFDGRPTASGEIFDSSLLTAAHPTLPFGTFVIVTNRHNNRQVTVRVNDRGPFVASRIIDVSRAAADHLDMIITGTAPVLVEMIQSGQHQVFTQPPAPTHPQFQHLPPAQPHPMVQHQPPVQPHPMIQHQQPTQPQPMVPQQPVQPQPMAQQHQPVFTQPPAQPQPQVYVIKNPAETSGPGAPITITVFPPTHGPAQPDPAPPPQAVLIPQAAISPANLPPAVSGARLVPAINPLPNKTYRLQVGSFKIARNAVDAYTKLTEAGLNPEYERHEDFFRVVLKGIRGTEVQSVANKLETAGFREAVIREE